MPPWTVCRPASSCSYGSREHHPSCVSPYGDQLLVTMVTAFERFEAAQYWFPMSELCFYRLEPDPDASNKTSLGGSEKINIRSGSCEEDP